MGQSKSKECEIGNSTFSAIAMAAGVPHIQLTIDHHTPMEGIRELMKTVRPTWTEKIQIISFKEGLTNELFGVFESDRKNMILVRIFGPISHQFIDRKRELRTLLLLNEYGCSEPVFATFDNGMCYGYVVGNILTIGELRSAELAAMMAKELARLHAIPIPEDYAPEIGNSPSILLQGAREMIGKLPEKLNNNERDAIYQKTIRIEALKQGIADLEHVALTYDEKLVICHHDLMNRNIVRNLSENRVYFIDFEYAGPSLPYIDIACFFVSHIGVEDPDSTKYPTKEYQRKFFKFYLEEKSRYQNEPVEITDELLELWYKRVSQMTLFPFLYWGLWCILQLENNHEYAFLEMGCLMIEHFFKVKDELFAM